MEQVIQAYNRAFKSLATAELNHLRLNTEASEEARNNADQELEALRVLHVRMQGRVDIDQPAVDQVVEQEVDDGDDGEEDQQPLEDQGPVSRTKVKVPSFHGLFTKEPAIFLRAREQALKTNQVPRTDWHLHLPGALEPPGQVWFYKFIDAKGITSWSTIKELFAKNFGGVDPTGLAFQQLAEIKQQSSESAEAFTSRFRDLMFDAQIQDDDANALQWFQRAVLPTKQDNLITMIAASKHPTISKAADLLRRLESARKSSTPLATPLYCTFCRRSSHSTAECRSRNTTPRAGDKRPDGPALDPGNIRCYNCGRNGHFSSTCPTRKKNNDSANINVVTLPSRPGVLIPITVNDQQVLSHLDTGADISVISATLAHQI